MSEKVEREKQPYEKPSLKIIELAADEVLAVGCKTGVSGSGGPFKDPVLNFSCISPACSTLGS